jgi:hypothetical protein
MSVDPCKDERKKRDEAKAEYEKLDREYNATRLKASKLEGGKEPPVQYYDLDRKTLQQDKKKAYEEWGKAEQNLEDCERAAKADNA